MNHELLVLLLHGSLIMRRIKDKGTSANFILKRRVVSSGGQALN